MIGDLFMTLLFQILKLTMGANAPRPHLWIDASLAGQTYQDDLPLPAFLAGIMREIVLSKDFPKVPKVIQRKVSHLSFLLHLLCRFDNFSLVYQHYCQVKILSILEISVLPLLRFWMISFCP